MTPDQQTQLQVSCRSFGDSRTRCFVLGSLVRRADSQNEVQRELERREWAEPNGACSA